MQTKIAEQVKARPYGSETGMTLVEVVVAIALATVVVGGLLSVGVKSQQYAEHSRVATEARALAKERIEEFIADGCINIRRPSYLKANADTNASNRGYPIVRRPSVIWHAADKSVVGVSSGVYAEVHIDVGYWTPLYDGTMTDTYSIVISQ